MLRPKSKWVWELLSPDLMLCSSLLEMRYSGRTPYQSVEVARTGSFGWCLILDGKVQSSEADEFVYHEALVHPPMITHPNPKRVFIAGGGEGAVAREVLAHRTVEKVVMIDIDQQVVEVCRTYLPGLHRGAFEDSRLELHFCDASNYLADTEDQYDVLIMDLPDPIEEGPAYLLYTQNFYRLVMRRLAPDGIVVVQAGSAFIPLYREVFTAIHHTMESVFPAVYPYCASVPAFGGVWGYVMASNGPNPWDLDASEVDRCLAERLVAPLRFYDGITHEALLRLPKYLRRDLMDEERLITEENPIFVY